MLREFCQVNIFNLAVSLNSCPVGIVVVQVVRDSLYFGNSAKIGQQLVCNREIKMVSDYETEERALRDGTHQDCIRLCKPSQNHIVVLVGTDIESYQRIGVNQVVRHLRPALGMP